MARSTLLKSSALALLVLLPLASLAEKTKPEPDEARARALYKDGQRSYDVGEFQKALTQFTDAYKARPLPGFLFNIAQCHRQLQDYKQAAFFFGRFIENSKPEAANVQLARQLLDEVGEKQRLIEQAKAAEEKRKADEALAAAATKPADAPVSTSLEPRTLDTTPPPPPPALEEPVTRKGWFWAVIGVGVALVAGGVTAGILANQPRTEPYTPTSTTLPDIDARTVK